MNIHRNFIVFQNNIVIPANNNIVIPHFVRNDDDDDDDDDDEDLDGVPVLVQNMQHVLLIGNNDDDDVPILVENMQRALVVGNDGNDDGDKKVNAKMLGGFRVDDVTAIPNLAECSICLDAMQKQNDDDDDATVPCLVRCPGCLQCFHCACIVDWFRESKKTGFSSSCPACRFHWSMRIGGECAESIIYESDGSSFVVDPADIELVVSQTNVSEEVARQALRRNPGDIVNAIMELTL